MIYFCLIIAFVQQLVNPYSLRKISLTLQITVLLLLFLITGCILMELLIGLDTYVCQNIKNISLPIDLGAVPQQPKIW